MFIEVVTHTSNPHTMSLSPPNACRSHIDIFSAELLEPPQCLQVFCGEPTTASRARVVASVLPSLGAATLGSELANSPRLTFSSRHFACARSFSRSLLCPITDLFVSCFSHCLFGLHFWVHHQGAFDERCRNGKNFFGCASKSFRASPQIMSRHQPSCFRLRMVQHDTTAALLLTVCSPVPVLNPNQQPSDQVTTSVFCGPAVLCDWK